MFCSLTIRIICSVQLNPPFRGGKKLSCQHRELCKIVLSPGLIIIQGNDLLGIATMPLESLPFA